jgi:hypothetical protein
LVFYLFFTNISLFLSETGTKAAEDIRKKEDYGYDELNASQLRRSAAHRAWQEKGKENQDEQGSDLQPELNINPKLSNGLRHLTRKKHHLSSDDQYGDRSSSDSNSCDVCPTDGPFRKRKYHFYILHDVTNVGLYDFFGGGSNSKEVESSIPVASFPITPVTSMPVIPLPLATLPPATSFQYTYTWNNCSPSNLASSNTYTCWNNSCPGNLTSSNICTYNCSPSNICTYNCSPGNICTYNCSPGNICTYNCSPGSAVGLDSYNGALICNRGLTCNGKVIFLAQDKRLFE